MHAAFFGLKRAYWGSLGTTRKKLTAMGLTAARFDLLYILPRSLWGFPVPQRSLHRKLGCTPPVVSRMLKSLRELGLVTRARCPTDTRRRLIGLTDKGRLLINRAIRYFMIRRRADRLVQQGLCPTMLPGIARRDAAFKEMCILEPILDNLRKGFNAGGTLDYPWHPDD